MLLMLKTNPYQGAKNVLRTVKTSFFRRIGLIHLNTRRYHAFSGGLPCGELNRIQGDTVPGNSASEAVLTKLGFKEEGLLRESGYWKGQFHDLKCLGLLKSEYTEILKEQ